MPRRISARTVTLVVVLVALAFAYAYPVRVYLGQQAEIDRLEQSQSDQHARIEQLIAQLKRWDDDQYVISEARRRLHWVREGELLYVVGTDSAAGGAAPADGADATWFNQVWSSLQSVDDPPVP